MMWITPKALLAVTFLVAPTILTTSSWSSQPSPAPSRSGGENFAAWTSGVSMNPAENCDSMNRVAQILSGAYQNATLHDAPNADLEEQDLLLESASIRFSSEMLCEMTQDSCNGANANEASAGVATPCVPADQSVELRNLADTLSAAAFRLESLSRSAALNDGSHSLALARGQSLQHLYRLAFTLSMANLDKTQNLAYLGEARQQLTSAREHLNAENSLCEGDERGYFERIQELAELDGKMANVRSQR